MLAIMLFKQLSPRWPDRLEAGGDHRHLQTVLELGIDHRAEEDLGVGIGEALLVTILVYAKTGWKLTFRSCLRFAPGSSRRVSH